jgi:hypothetical protein
LDKEPGILPNLFQISYRSEDASISYLLGIKKNGIYPDDMLSIYASLFVTAFGTYIEEEDGWARFSGSGQVGLK